MFNMQREDQFLVYLQHFWAGPSRNQYLVVDAENAYGGYGSIIAINWSVHDGPERNAKVVAHLRGQLMKVVCGADVWNSTVNIVFGDGRFNGSTLEVRGTWTSAKPFELAIVGGTGQFTLAQGIIYGKTIRQIGNDGRIIELRTRVFYRPLEQPGSTSVAPLVSTGASVAPLVSTGASGVPLGAPVQL